MTEPPALPDPVRQRVIEALARRAVAQQGLARQLLLQRVAQLQAERTQAEPMQAEHQALLPAAATGAGFAQLSDLVDRLGRVPRLPTTMPAPLKAVAGFKGTWLRLRAEQRLRQAWAEVPAQAGPLNASHVVHRGLQALHGLSPAYLDAFMSQVDTLLGLEQASGAGELAPRRGITKVITRRQTRSPR